MCHEAKGDTVFRRRRKHLRERGFRRGQLRRIVGKRRWAVDHATPELDQDGEQLVALAVAARAPPICGFREDAQAGYLIG